MYYLECSVAQAAEHLGIPSGTVKSRAFYAMRALRKALEERGALGELPRHDPDPDRERPTRTRATQRLMTSAGSCRAAPQPSPDGPCR
ncbi:sigma factor-like helix-turn-helix DNA-binding protein [Streptomyces sp. NPDC058291]|uniref:sigma factor-like helix-turn-helix DNA-binding protein n=1 Tax=Streptomyces sp. NPDC058291 TaxID=3346427 RepID=UPI0036E1CEC8